MIPLDQLLHLLFYFTLFLGSFFVAYENLWFKVYELVIFLAMHAMNKKQSDTRKEERCSDSVVLNT